MNEPSLEELLTQLQANWQEPVFRQFYSRTSGLVYAYLKKRFSSVESAEEILQIVYLQIYRKIEQYDPKFKALQWLYVIAQSESRDYWLKERRHSLNKKDDFNLDQVSQNPSEIPNTLQIDLDGLTADQKAVIMGRFNEDLDFEEIALRLGKSPSNVRKILSRAVEFLRTKTAINSKGG